MKKQLKKLSLNKKTISNLNEVEMNKKVGGVRTYYYCHTGGNWCGNYTQGCGGGATKNGNTCAGHNTCQYTCV
jgi:hypothetical protein